MFWTCHTIIVPGVMPERLSAPVQRVQEVAALVAGIAQLHLAPEHRKQEANSLLQLASNADVLAVIRRPEHMAALINVIMEQTQPAACIPVAACLALAAQPAHRQLIMDALHSLTASCQTADVGHGHVAVVICKLAESAVLRPALVQQTAAVLMEQLGRKTYLGEGRKPAFYALHNLAQPLPRGSWDHVQRLHDLVADDLAALLQDQQDPLARFWAASLAGEFVRSQQQQLARSVTEACLTPLITVLHFADPTDDPEDEHLPANMAATALWWMLPTLENHPLPAGIADGALHTLAALSLPEELQDTWPAWVRRILDQACAQAIEPYKENTAVGAPHPNRGGR